MNSRARWAVLLGLAVVLVLGIAASPAVAIIGGQRDVDNTYSNVGVIVAHHDYGWDLVGSCTLVKNDAGNVAVLTAGHVTAYLAGVDGPGIANTRVSFAPLTDWDATAWPRQDLPFTSYQAVACRTHPEYVASLLATPLRGNSKMLGIGPGREDVGLLWLDSQVPGLTPATIAGIGALDGLTLRRETFTTVGYGYNEVPVGNFAAAARNPNFVLTWSGRNYRDCHGVTNHEALADRYLKTTMCSNFGDSGGPVFHDGVIAALTSWGESLRAASPAYDYRLDTKSAYDFLAGFLTAGP
jgi:hypothetical protein